MKHILIDYENIQPKGMDGIDTSADEYHIWLFLGVNQQKSLPLELVETLLNFNHNHVHIIKMQHSGKNALDFYLSFYLGKISEIDPQADICIWAKDSGYDVLVEHLNSVYEGIDIMRLATTDQLSFSYAFHEDLLEAEQTQCITQDKQITASSNHLNAVIKNENSLDHEKQIPKISTQKTSNEQARVTSTIYQQAIASLKKCPSNTRPSKKSSLINYLKSHLRNENLKVIDNIIKQMINNKVIDISDTNTLSYNV